jgi:hypothetical protein
MAAWAAKQHIRFVSISFLIAQGAKASKDPQFFANGRTLLPWLLGQQSSTQGLFLFIFLLHKEPMQVHCQNLQCRRRSRLRFCDRY